MKSAYHVRVGPSCYPTGMGLFNWKDTVRSIIFDLELETRKAMAEHNAPVAQTLQIVMRILRARLLPGE